MELPSESKIEVPKSLPTLLEEQIPKQLLKQFRWEVFLPVFISLNLAVLLSAISPEVFGAYLNAANQWILWHLGSTFGVTGLLALIACIAVPLSPLGSLRIGGPTAKQSVSTLGLISISICTSIAAGLLFWSCAEPLYHLSAPPVSLGLAPMSAEAARFSMRSLLLHWTIIPNAFYVAPAVVLAFAFHQMRRPLSLSACLEPIFSISPKSRLGRTIDTLSLFGLVNGMAASLGSGILTLAGGLEHLTGIPSDGSTWFVVGCVIVAAFLVSAMSGLERGILWLSYINLKFLLGLMLLMFFAGPTGYLLSIGAAGASDLFGHLGRNALFLDYLPTDPWPRMWTVFYWTSWLAWAPVTAIFLARIGVGFTYRAFVCITLLCPSVMSGVWMVIFGGSTLGLATEGNQSLVSLLQSRGPESIAYALLGTLPMSTWVISAFLLTAFISFVTAADSNTLALSGLSCRNISAEKLDSPKWVQMLWGLTIGGVSIAALYSAGLEGIKALCTVGGTPSLFIELLAIVNLFWILPQPHRFLSDQKELTPEHK